MLSYLFVKNKKHFFNIRIFNGITQAFICVVQGVKIKFIKRVRRWEILLIDYECFEWIRDFGSIFDLIKDRDMPAFFFFALLSRHIRGADRDLRCAINQHHVF